MSELITDTSPSPAGVSDERSTKKSMPGALFRTLRTGAPVRRVRNSAPGIDFLVLRSSLTPAGEGLVSVMSSDIVAIYSYSATADCRGPVRSNGGLRGVDLGHGWEGDRALGSRGQLRQESLVHAVIGDHSGQLDRTGVALKEQILSDRRVQVLLPEASGRRVRGVLGDRLGVVRRNRSVRRDH